ncbi:MAG: LLM class flavin-dependent oxidoreductase [Solirubrobacterales bacterium]|nr:LLM class flavin-dependent oxidoreductase [Solirubrobacterales bacterium]
MRLCLMIEGQEDVGWERWLELAGACERAGLEGLFRSDHYLSVAERRDRGSLDAWGTICALAARTERLHLGTLVSPVTFRHPSNLAKLAATAAEIAGPGRIEVGLGAGWWEAEHRAYGFELPPVGERMEMLAEQLELIVGEWTEADLSFEGEHYSVSGLDARPKPDPRPRVIVGGSGRPRSVALAARWADEYNTLYKTPAELRPIREAVLAARERENPDRPISFSLMTGLLVATDGEGLRERARALAEWRGEPADDPDSVISSLPDAWIIGTVDEAATQLAELERVGVERVMLQHHLHTDTDTIELIGRELG